MTASGGQDPTRGYHGGNEQSVAAFESVRPGLPRQRQVVFEAVWIAMPDGLTCDELLARLGGEWVHQAVSARMTELKRDGWLVVRELAPPEPGSRRRGTSTVVTRPTRRGRQAAVHYVPEHLAGQWPPAATGTAPEPARPAGMPAPADGEDVLF